MKDPITGHGKDPIFYYDDEIAECSCRECQKYRMCWPREMFGAPSTVRDKDGVLRVCNERGCSLWTKRCAQRHKKMKRLKNPEWQCFMNWRKLVYAEGFTLSNIRRYRNQEKTMKHCVLYQEVFLPLFDVLDKNDEGQYIDPVWRKSNGWHCDEILEGLSVDRRDNTMSHLVISNLQIVSLRYNKLKSNSTEKEREVMANYDNIR